MILANFKRCYVCGEEVMTLVGTALAACSTHSSEDRLRALDKMQVGLDAERERAQEGQ